MPSMMRPCEVSQTNRSSGHCPVQGKVGSSLLVVQTSSFCDRRAASSSGLERHKHSRALEKSPSLPANNIGHRPMYTCRRIKKTGFLLKEWLQSWLHAKAEHGSHSCDFATCSKQERETVARWRREVVPSLHMRGGPAIGHLSHFQVPLLGDFSS